MVNCTGLGARTLVPDPGMRPVRGQLVVVENPGVTEWYTSVDHASSDTTYFFPQPYGLLLGGTAQDDDWDLAPDPRVAEEIVARCALVRPEIAGARVLAHRVGLRPVRDAGVRIEAETTASGGLLVHNYGHGGAGITVAWGCAREAAALAASRTPPVRNPSQQRCTGSAAVSPYCARASSSRGTSARSGWRSGTNAPSPDRLALMPCRARRSFTSAYWAAVRR